MEGLAVLQCNNPEETRCGLIGACYLTPVADAPSGCGSRWIGSDTTWVHRARTDTVWAAARMY